MIVIPDFVLVKFYLERDIAWWFCGVLLIETGCEHSDLYAVRCRCGHPALKGLLIIVSFQCYWTFDVQVCSAFHFLFNPLIRFYFFSTICFHVYKFTSHLCMYPPGTCFLDCRDQ